ITSGIAAAEAIFDLIVPALLVAAFAHALMKCSDVGGIQCDRCRLQHCDTIHLAQLRTRRERPRSRRAAEQRDELAAFHSIASLMRISRDRGISTPRALAVWRLMMSSILTAC